MNNHYKSHYKSLNQIKYKINKSNTKNADTS